MPPDIITPNGRRSKRRQQIERDVGEEHHRRQEEGRSPVRSRGENINSREEWHLHTAEGDHMGGGEAAASRGHGKSAATSQHTSGSIP
jgi:hypothetical protein